MSVLKKKVTLAIAGNKAHARAARRREQQRQLEQPPRVDNAEDIQQGNINGQQQLRREPIADQTIKTRANNSRLTRRKIMGNYSRAILNFALSTFALSPLDEIFSAYQINGQNFREFIRNRDTNVDSITNLRNFLFVQRTDSQETTKLKRAFKELCLVFLKTFSLNWILHSKVEHKVAHIKYRFKMLRRLTNPRLFAQL